MQERSPQDPGTLTPKQVAKRWGGCKVHTILKHIAAGRLDAFDISQNPGVGRPRWLIHIDAVRAYEQRNSATAQADAKRRLRAQRRQRRSNRVARIADGERATDNTKRMGAGA